MKPIKLTMQAFGPYRQQETVDFTELGQNRVFLIHGDTGAGKTTVLDAMVFALYGFTSGGERTAGQMRCESAPEGLATEVTFDFSLKGKAFRVIRRPEQEIVGARGRKVPKAAVAMLWDRTGCGEAEEGKPLASKIREVDARIKDELGFSCDQFRQVVVLPQGRFRELLSAGSDKREEILRQLFKTARFRQLEEALAERAKAVRDQMAALKAERSAQLKVVDAADDAGLAALLAAASSEHEAATAHVGEAKAGSLQADEILNAAEGAVEARAALAAARTELERLEALGPDVEVFRLRLDVATRAEKVHPAADKVADARKLKREVVEDIHSEMCRLLPIARVEVCYEDGYQADSQFYKPAPGMLRRAADELGLDLTASIMIGDRWRDIDCGHAAGCRTIFIEGNYVEKLKQKPDFCARNLGEAADIILAHAK